MRELVPGGGLERVRERVTEVELRPLSLLARITQTDGGLERCAPPHLGGPVELPDGLASEQPSLHDLGKPVRDLGFRQRLEHLGVRDGPRGPVERSDEVLPLRDVDPGLPSQGCVDLCDERRGYRRPRDAPHVGRRDEARQVDRRAASERDQNPPAVEPKRRPQPLRLRQRLRVLARRELVR